VTQFSAPTGKNKGCGSTGHGSPYLARIVREAAVATVKYDTVQKYQHCRVTFSSFRHAHVAGCRLSGRRDGLVESGEGKDSSDCTGWVGEQVDPVVGGVDDVDQ
jgi:hypothetical protein